MVNIEYFFAQVLINAFVIKSIAANRNCTEIEQQSTNRESGKNKVLVIIDMAQIQNKSLVDF